jgi:hypothetical protein
MKDHPFFSADALKSKQTSKAFFFEKKNLKSRAALEGCVQRVASAPRKLKFFASVCSQKKCARLRLFQTNLILL